MSDYVIVTGANRGIGLATSEAFAQAGLRVAMVGRNRDAIDEQASRVGARAVYCDVSDALAIERAFKPLLADWGAPRAVVHNAGIVRRASVESATDDDWHASLATNLSAPFYLTRTTLPIMRAAGRGRHVYIASISSTLGTPRLSAYCASKWGVIGLMKSVAEELRGSGLQAIAVLPGSVDTDMLKGSGFAPQMTPADIAGTVLYAALHAPDAMNGSALEVFGP